MSLSPPIPPVPPFRFRRSGGRSNVRRWRGLLAQLLATDLRGRYAGSLLGPAWNLVHPLVMVGIFTLVFSDLIGARLGRDPGDRLAFSLYLCAGLLPWTGFTEVISRSTGVFLEHANLVKKMAFPRLLLHVHILISAAIHTGLLCAVFIVFLGIAGRLPSPSALAVWLAMIMLQLLLGAGIGLITSLLNVFVRDVGQVVAVALPIWFWLTPIVYVAEVLPPVVRRLVWLNPLFHFCRVHQGLMLSGTLPSVPRAAMMALASTVVPLLGFAAYLGLRRRIADEL